MDLHLVCRLGIHHLEQSTSGSCLARGSYTWIPHHIVLLVGYLQLVLMVPCYRRSTLMTKAVQWRFISPREVFQGTSDIGTLTLGMKKSSISRMM